MDTTKVVGMLLATLMIATAMIPMVGAYITPDIQKTTNVAEGGNITNLDFYQEGTSTLKWQGYYGNLTGSITLNNSTGTGVMYTWGAWDNSSHVGYVLATTNATTPDWADLVGSNGSEVDTAWDFVTDDGDCANNTFNESWSSEITIAFNTIAVNTASNVTTNNNTTNYGYWETIVVKQNATIQTDDFDEFVFVGVNDAADEEYSFDDKPVDYQMMVPVNLTAGGAAGTQTYYFYTELRTS